MDSGNSGSMQSSSGGDEEYDSRAETISAFLNHHHHHNQSSHVGPMPNPPAPQQPPPTHHHSSMFDPLSNYFDPLSSRSPPPPQLGGTNPNSLLNLDMVWSKSLRSEPNCTDLGGFMASSSSASTQQLLTNQAVLQGRGGNFPAMQLHEGVTKGSLSGSSSVSGLNIDQTNINSGSNITSNNSGGMVRNPKKRSRASRRAPTTVLTTDTTNFRAMVQEFTGIPAPPFTSSAFPRTRLDLFGTSSTLRSTTTHLDPSPPPYLLRPFAQKFHPPPFVSPSTTTTSLMIDAIASTTNLTSSAASASNNNSNSNSTSINYQLPSQQHQNLLNMNNMQNPILNLQSFLQPHPPVLGNKPPPQAAAAAASLDIPTNDSHSHHLKIGVLEELGLSHGHLNTNLSGGLQNIVSSDATLPIRSDNSSNNNNSNNPSSWPPAGDGTGSNESDQGLFRSIGGNFNASQRVTNGKVTNFSPSSSDFLREKGQENVATTTRTEGMVESWICSSD